MYTRESVRPGIYIYHCQILTERYPVIDCFNRKGRAFQRDVVTSTSKHGMINITVFTPFYTKITLGLTVLTLGLLRNYILNLTLIQSLSNIRRMILFYKIPITNKLWAHWAHVSSVSSYELTHGSNSTWAHVSSYNISIILNELSELSELIWTHTGFQ